MDRIIQFLTETNLVPFNALTRANQIRSASGVSLDVALIQLGLLSEQDFAAAAATALNLPQEPLTKLPEEPLWLERLPKTFLATARCVPIADEPDCLVLAMANPTDDEVAQAIEYAIRKPARRCVAKAIDIEKAIERLYSEPTDGPGAIASTAEPPELSAHDVDRLRDLASEAPVIQLVNRWITDAVELGASDIHIEPSGDLLRVRIRVDGGLVDVEGQSSRLHAAVVSRIKVMARLDIAERRLPQDGRIGVPVRGAEVDLRVSIIPTVQGESVVLRILDQKSVSLDFATLGFSGTALDRLLQILRQPDGVLLVTGPTGSGKTTTLYTSLLHLRTDDVKILTVEDPVEYRLEGISQAQVHPQIGLDFGLLLRSFLRHNPNIMMVGEIRDLETAQSAVRAALTGHQVLSTLHTNNAVSAVSRLMDMGVEHYMIAATVRGILAQRLVRRLCESCKRPQMLEAHAAEAAGFSGLTGAGGPVEVHVPVGCPLCRHTGYAGREVICEALPVSPSIRQLVLRRASEAELADMARAEGMETMRESGLRKVLQGITSIEEVLRATLEI